MGEPNGIGAANLRVARPTDDLDAVVRVIGSVVLRVSF